MSFALSKKNTSVVQNSKPDGYTVHFFEKKLLIKISWFLFVATL